MAHGVDRIVRLVPSNGSSRGRRKLNGVCSRKSSLLLQMEDEDAASENCAAVSLGGLSYVALPHIDLVTS